MSFTLAGSPDAVPEGHRAPSLGLPVPALQPHQSSRGSEEAVRAWVADVCPEVQPSATVTLSSWF